MSCLSWICVTSFSREKASLISFSFCEESCYWDSIFAMYALLRFRIFLFSAMT